MGPTSFIDMKQIPAKIAARVSGGYDQQATATCVCNILMPMVGLQMVTLHPLPKDNSHHGVIDAPLIPQPNTEVSDDQQAGEDFST